MSVAGLTGRTSPAYGIVGNSYPPKRPVHPVPEYRVIPNPRIRPAVYSYPPFSPTPALPALYVVGLGCTMPNGTAAPGNVLPYASLLLFWVVSISVPMNWFTASNGDSS